MTNVLQPYQWISVSVIGFIASILNCYILKKEYRKRQTATNTIWPNRHMKIWPIACMICGIISPSLNFIGYLPIMCNIVVFIQSLAMVFQAVFMGFYQLDRLYYCFAKAMVHSDHGYPHFVFIIMYFVGILAMINSIVFLPIVNQFDINCGINNKYEYYPLDATITTVTSIQHTKIWANITTFIALIWDVVTLLLYIWKVIQIHIDNSVKKVVKERVISILNRILIPTLFYEFAFLMILIVSAVNNFAVGLNDVKYILNHVSFAVAAVMMNYSMFLMQSYNTDEYYWFLSILHKYKVYFIGCCCFCYCMISNELNYKTNINIETKDNQEQEITSNSVEPETSEKCKPIEPRPNASRTQTVSIQYCDGQTISFED